MKKHITTILLVCIFLVGVGLIMYPTLANYWNERIYRHAIVNYENVVADSGTDTTSELVTQALEYNASLAEHGNYFGRLTETQKEEYNKQLSLKGDDVSNMLGYLEIPNYNIALPVYRGTNDVVLASGVGHLEGTSLPIGGINSHCVMSGHTGLPSAKLLTDLEKVQVGDLFYMKVLGEKLVYEVDQILVVLPDDMSALQIIEGMDLCTLVTCTPYGINSHRLLVRGHRIEEEREQVIIKEQEEKKSSENKNNLIITIIIGTVLILFLLWIMLFYGKKRRRGGKADNRDSEKADSGDKT